MVNHYTYKIQDVIQSELFNATVSIKIAVAWFTNNLLFQPLLMKLMMGVHVEIILNKDDINLSACDMIDYTRFLEYGGVLRWNYTKTLMHEKFCIIDNRVVITGSYNWTNKAEYNHETISVFKDDASTVWFYANLFNDLALKYPAEHLENARKYSFQPYETINIPQKDDSLNAEGGMRCLIGKKVFSECAFDVSNDIFVKYKEAPELFFFDISGGTLGYEKYCCVKNKVGKFILISPETFAPLSNIFFDDAIFQAGNIWVKNGEYWAFLDLRRSLSKDVPLFRLGQQRPDTKYIYILNSNKWGVIDQDSQVILNCEYDEMVIYPDVNMAMMRVNAQYGLALLAERKMYDCIYTHEQISRLISNLLKK